MVTSITHDRDFACSAIVVFLNLLRTKFSIDEIVFMLGNEQLIRDYLEALDKENNN